jgi:hypothetical protein
MANLIIKSSADNLVLQGSDASPAITVGATGTTTFAENATMSGVTTLTNATITAGTFPSGHIIQVNSSHGYALQNLDTDIDVVMEVSLSNVEASSHVYISWQIPFLINTDSTSNEGAEVYLYRDASSQSVGATVSGTNIVAGDAGNTDAVGWIFKSAADVELYSTESGSCIDESALTGTNVYKLCASSYSTTSPVVCGHDGLISITAMEIAR